jgi:hypothetical protein
MQRVAVIVLLIVSRQGFEVLPPIKVGKCTAVLGGVRALVRRLNAADAGAVGSITSATKVGVPA